ncbi:MAG: 2-oxoacid:acceptor oxidoreductase family protein [Negativicutes bacterium]|nr:2-oxoacid:acceptor oxidoreductase family protein [Negativicutes bacterium]
MNQQTEIRLSGSGGQGIITAGIILAEAALLDGLNALQSQSYGPEARGGASKAEVIISEKEINYPKVTQPNILVALTQQAYDIYKSGLMPDSIVMLDAGIVVDSDAAYRVYQIAVTEIARTQLRPVVANIITLGALVTLTQCVSYTALEEAVLDRVPKGTEELNKKALAAGVAAAKQLIA